MLESGSDNAEIKLIDFGLSKTYITKCRSMDDVVGTVYVSHFAAQSTKIDFPM